MVVLLIVILAGLLGAPLNSANHPGDDLYLGDLGDDPVAVLALVLTVPHLTLFGLAWATRPGRSARQGNAGWRRLRSLMAIIAIIACLLGLVTGLRRRGESFERLASYHLQARNHLYHEIEPLPDSGTTEQTIKIVASRGPAASRALEAAMYHDVLFGKYASAAKHPWYPLGADPPPPPAAYPKFAYDRALKLEE